MKLVTCSVNGNTRVCTLNGNTLTPLNLGPEQARQGLTAVIEQTLQGVTIDSLQNESDDSLALGDVKILAPIPRPARNIFCVGLNYRDHAREIAGTALDDGKGNIPTAPIIFTKVPETVIGDQDDIHYTPAISTAIDYEVELAVIIGKPGYRITEADAMSHVWGYTIINDVTARDWQKRHQQWHLGKSFPTFCPMGPIAVTADEIDPDNTPVRSYVNGELRQESNTSQFIFNVPALIACIAGAMPLVPGDIIATGTPAGVGMGFDPPRYLEDGDRSVVEIEGIGRLENPVRAVP